MKLPWFNVKLIIERRRFWPAKVYGMPEGNPLSEYAISWIAPELVLPSWTSSQYGWVPRPFGCPPVGTPHWAPPRWAPPPPIRQAGRADGQSSAVP